MANEFGLVATKELKSAEIKWELCFLCQSSKKEQLQRPAVKKGILSNQFSPFFTLVLVYSFFRRRKGLKYIAKMLS